MAPSDMIALQAASLVVVPVPVSVQVAVIVLVHDFLPLLLSSPLPSPKNTHERAEGKSILEILIYYTWETEKKESRSNLEAQEGHK